MTNQAANSRRNAFRKAGIAATILLAAALVTACGSGNNTSTTNSNVANPSAEDNDPASGATAPDPADQTANGSGGTSASNDAANANAGTSDNDTSVNNSTADSDASGIVLEGTGTYTGQIDSHSVEIDTAEGPQAFQIDDKLAEVVSGLEMDAKVAFEYTEKEIDNGGEKVKQLWLADIRLQ
ncbi:hypothetical protein BG53_14515 [Paenibacillus darwinianus]|uniref:Lipoprotein n=1 Tax=Paenibacillus darwinianus TaxID=1380763 RepID=A0A9W5S330_9BACL|nr:hypothetical protein [Paenibacillus darwinianus]EXX89675.1 hypothetical protein BG52_15005 [Paenibacillus darwinianus]EXX89979.1 hypothetical protein BG53_14515 [Paenibacillus darwinianus]EXX90238.1 hypothetical protein CH50_16005 [Paenibacillus darwinianus]